MNVLIAGESWMTHSIHVKGFDSFTTSSYNEGVGPLREALEAGQHTVTYLPNHIAPKDFPTTLEDLQAYDAVILSDIGVNTLLLPDQTFIRSESMPNRLELLKSYVKAGGGLLMIGGYLTFQGIEGKGAYHGTAVEEILPVNFFPYDDRREAPQGVTPDVVADHPVIRDVKDWPVFLGYNRSTLKEGATLVARIGDNPFIALYEYGQGRSSIFASDCGPHWGPPAFLKWQHYPRLWQQLVEWLGEGDR